MISIKSKREIELLRIAGNIVYQTHQYLRPFIKEGITTKEIDRLGEEFIRSKGCTPSFKGYNDYPASICTSINQEVVHGIPSDRKLRNGDIITLDIGACYKGYHGDSAWTYAVGEISEERKYLMEHTEKSLYEGLSVIKPGAHIGDIGLTLIEFHPGEAFSVAREIHVPVVVSLYIRYHGQVAGKAVGFEVTSSGVHCHCYRTSGVVAVKKFLLQFIGCYAPIVERQVGVRLQFISKAPKHDGRMVTVALDPLGQIVLPLSRPIDPSSGILFEPLVIQFIHHQNAIFVAEPVKVFTIRIMRSADMVESEILQQFDAFLYRLGVSGGPQRSERVMVGDTFENYLFSIDFQSEIR